MSILDVFSGCFCLSGVRVVLGMFWETFWCQNEKQKAKGGFVKMFVLPSKIAVFVVCGFNLACENEKNRMGFRYRLKLCFMMIYGSF